VLNSYLEGVKADTVLDNRLALLKKGGDFFKGRKQYDKESQLRQMILDIKPNPTLTDYFNANIAYYFGANYAAGRQVSLAMIEKYPEEVYGFEWAFNHARAIDTVRKDSIAVPDALKLIEYAQRDTIKFKKQIFNTAGFLVNYYANDAKDPATALTYLDKMIIMEPGNENLKGIREQLLKASKAAPKGAVRSKPGSPLGRLNPQKVVNTA
jgi:hypothetical protein